MTPVGLEDWLSSLGRGLRCVEEKFIVTMGAGMVGTAMLIFGFLNQDHFIELIQWTVGPFIAGVAWQKGKEAAAKGTP